MDGMGLVIIGLRYSKSTFDANNDCILKGMEDLLLNYKFS